ncbi:rhamnulokinase [Nonomuraea roseoviolacea]|uniref:Rhamnulokinase n=1 Tax=Nonomuraea roseoviolacea subsp. carminata TaxID=160689 RepID=A0ABT1K9B7_9ACTN|nr:rhamnulokinase family protein [Nonomuraea roseoviolacea]MCP2350545.1 rhamnulokinase [Nonomuraea roseoviolacea subsp. carminata]
MRFTAVDLGASSGRVMIADITPGAIELTEAHRFPNRPVRVAGTLHWDILALHQGVLDGLRKAGPAESAGIDSWAVDYGLFDAAGRLIGNPVHYRDSRTADITERIDPYEVTGLQFLPFTTVNQLLRERLDGAETLLMIPDLIGYWLTGRIGAERTNASTTGLYDVTRRDWAWDLVDRLGLPRRILPPITDAASGPVRDDVAAELGYSTVVTQVASHDTASAVVAVPAAGPHFAYISCGTWSLVGVELPEPVLTEESRLANFTNETGVDGTVRYLRNVMGLWILQECLRVWDHPDLEALLAEAGKVRVEAVIDPDDPSFLPPGDMPARIGAYCARTGQRPPEGRAQAVRCILQSLALAYGRAVDDAARLSGRPVEVVHLVGGGSRNALLCRLTAEATGLPVVAGPVEAAALGNALVQARARGLVGDLAEMRDLVRRSADVRTYEPRGREWPQ